MEKLQGSVLFSGISAPQKAWSRRYLLLGCPWALLLPTLFSVFLNRHSQAIHPLFFCQAFLLVLGLIEAQAAQAVMAFVGLVDFQYALLLPRFVLWPLEL